MQVKDIATMHAVSVKAESSIEEIGSLFRDWGIGFMPVLAQGIPIGVITDRDIVTRVVANGFDTRTTRAYDVMTPYALSVPCDEDIEKAEARMSAYGIRRLLVVDRFGQLVGVLSIDDLARHCVDPTNLSQIVGWSANNEVQASEPSFLS